MKRAIDIIVSGIGLVILSPICLILAICIVADSPGGVFFRGPRVGKNGKIFYIYKFRSMVKDAEGHGKWNVGDNDTRITRMGHFLRKSKLDEIPQLINVFKGDMSLVGYRPELKYYVDMYTEREKPILDLKPGITDWASITNFDQFIGFTKATDPDQYYLNVVRPLKLKLQLYYRYHHNLRDDFRCIMWTGYKVLTRSSRLPKEIQKIVDDYKDTNSKQK
ncbi:MAG TPA: sugar transferase [Candidatus Blautia merdipullorum]|nr:sugar transferase [Candidatus Blautia merdipullorum]